MTPAEQAAREFFRLYPPPDTNWYVDEILIPALTDALLTRERAAQEQIKRLRAIAQASLEHDEIRERKLADAEAKVEAARREERERCAKVADMIHAEEVGWMGHHFNTAGEPLAAASAHAAKKIAQLIRRDPAGDS